MIKSELCGKHQLTYKPYLSRLENERLTLLELKKNLKTKKIMPYKLGMKYIGVGLAHAPQLSLDAASMLISCIRAGLMCEVGLECNIGDLVLLSPSSTTFHNTIKTLATYCTIALKKIYQINLCIYCL